MFKFKTPSEAVEVIITSDVGGGKSTIPQDFKEVVEQSVFGGIENYLRDSIKTAIANGDENPEASCTTFMGTYKVVKDKRGAYVIEFSQSDELIAAIQDPSSQNDDDGVFSKISEWLTKECRPFVRASMGELYDDESVPSSWEELVFNYATGICDSIGEIVAEVNTGATPWDIAIEVFEDGLFEHGTFTISKVSGVISMSFTPSKAFKQAIKDDTTATSE